MPSLHLTDIAVRALKPAPETSYYWDTQLPAFGVRVGKNSKTWTIIRGEKRQRVTIGRYPALSLAEARAEARRLLMEPSKSKQSSLSFKAARALYIEQHTGRDRTKKEARRLLEKHFKLIEHRDLPEITDQEIQAILAKLTTTPSEALHAFRAVRAFFRWCARPPRRYIAHSPLEGYDAPSQDRKRGRTLSDQELMRVWNACSGNWGLLVRILILWGTRKTETALMRRKRCFGPTFLRAR